MKVKIQEVFEALADPNRRQILDILKSGERSVGEISKRFGITGASMSHHLNKLKAADLVLTRRQGQSIYYSFHTTVCEDVAKAVAHIFSLGGKTHAKHSEK